MPARPIQAYAARVGSALCLIVLVAGCGGSGETCRGDTLDVDAEAAAVSAVHVAVNAAVPAGNEPLRSIVEAVEGHDDEHVRADDDPEPCNDDLSAEFGYLITMSTLSTHPDLASPELVDRLLQAASGGDSLMGQGGVVGVYAFLKSPDVYLPDYPGLEELRDLVREQEHALDDYTSLLQVAPVEDG